MPRFSGVRNKMAPQKHKPPGSIYVATRALMAALDGTWEGLKIVSGGVWPVRPIGHWSIIPKPADVGLKAWYMRMLRARIYLDEWNKVSGMEPYTFGLRFKIRSDGVYVKREAHQTERFWPVAVVNGFTEAPNETDLG